MIPTDARLGRCSATAAIAAQRRSSASYRTPARWALGAGFGLVLFGRALLLFGICGVAGRAPPPGIAGTLYAAHHLDRAGEHKITGDAFVTAAHRVLGPNCVARKAVWSRTARSNRSPT